MSDFEQKMREALTTASAGAPSAGGLAEGARGRARRRRRMILAGSAGLVAVAVAVPVALALAVDSPRADGGPLARDPGVPAASQPPEGWRTVEWEGMSVQVPEGWADGARTAWCVGGGQPDVPVVERPDTMAATVDCGEPRRGFGLSISTGPDRPRQESIEVTQAAEPRTGDPAEVVPGSWLGHWSHGELRVEVNAASRDTVERVLASIVVVGPAVGPTVEHQGVSVELPLAWVELDRSGCEFDFTVYGPEASDPCRPEQNLAFYASATFDPAYGPGIHRNPDGDGWGGYTYVDDTVVWVTATERDVVERVLDSAR